MATEDTDMASRVAVITLSSTLGIFISVSFCCYCFKKRRVHTRFVEYCCNIIGIHKNRIDELKTEINDRNTTITYLENKCDRLENSVKDLSHRLSAEMGKKVAADESSVENVGIKNRPMNIKDEYELMCTTEWFGAKTECDEMFPERWEAEKVTLLHNIMMEAEKHTNKVLHYLTIRTGDILNNPFRIVKEGQGQESQGQGLLRDTRPVKLPIEITNAIGDYLRNNADSVDIMPCEKKLVAEIDQAVSDEHMKDIWMETKDTFKMKTYISKVFRLTWKMVIQRPKMKFFGSDEWHGDSYQDLHWGSEKPAVLDKAKYNVTPVYPLLYHDKKFMAKGKVFIWPKAFVTDNVQ